MVHETPREQTAPTRPARTPGRTSGSSGSRRRSVTRGLAMFTCAVATVGVLSACQKPTPIITLFSGARSVHTDALCWSYDEATQVNNTACQAAVKDLQPVVLAAVARTTIGISVDVSIAANGWVPMWNGAALSGPITSTYYSLALSDQDLATAPGLLTVQGLTANGTAVRGLWAVHVVKP